jgi:UDP-4-amino-4,6-dideoxy-N-acetyl-beta-L-altrosamine N-acetyltransferase
MASKDLPIVLRWRNHDYVREFMFEQSQVNELEHQEWFFAASADPNRELLIFEQNAQALGFVQLRTDNEAGLVEWGFYASPEAPRGTGTAMLNCALNHVFKGEKAYKVCGRVLARNKASIRLHQKLGFRQEGILRQHHFDGSVLHDVHLFGMLNSEWKCADTL